ncbi:2-oxoacid:acceptor oxidoreductase family protein [bacterium]|nr:2-oxoacid:acceptor oxidoreductase family protein [bacterium]MBU1599696.1 2-oxoacid:acceptor oxidoreductase family protein [bacterium]MBU2461716.1 2-oxoacid:acceptor oxidoreductase family protein [bacterium]
MIEIRWHGRGGQGAKTAALLFADAVMHEGKWVQAFPEYGPERMGAPVQAFNRLSDEPILLHCGISSPDIVVVLDPTLCSAIDVTAGLRENGRLLVNTEKRPEDFRKERGFSTKAIFTVDASKIAIETIGKNIPNTPMLGALIKVSGVIPIATIISYTEKKMTEKFKDKPEVIKGNLEAIKRAYDEVVG